MLTLERLKEVLDCDPEAGTFTWKQARAGAVVPAGGTSNAKGYARICIDYALHYRHRLVWLYVHGEWPTETIDHINGVPGDDRISNLRPASYSQNNANRRAEQKFKGVSRSKGRQRWAAAIHKDNKRIYLGVFGTPEEAHTAYQQAARLLHGEFARFS